MSQLSLVKLVPHTPVVIDNRDRRKSLLMATATLSLVRVLLENKFSDRSENLLSKFSSPVCLRVLARIIEAIQHRTTAAHSLIFSILINGLRM